MASQQNNINNNDNISNDNTIKSDLPNNDTNGKELTEEEIQKKNNVLNPAIAIGAFNGTILLYYVLRYFFIDSKMEFKKKNFLILTGVFIAIVITTQITLYTMVSQAQHNGKKNIIASVLFTLITNILYVGSVIILLFLLPGFKEPFSNTFGYLIVYLFGVKYAMNRLLLSSDEGGDIVKRVYQNPSVLINLITTKNFNKVMDKLQKGDPPIIDPEPNDLKKLFKLVALKDMIGEWIWIMLAGALAISTGYNMMISLPKMENE
jgi:hypothetical protein